MQAKELNWSVLGVGVIANEMAQALLKMGRKLYAVGNRTHEKAAVALSMHSKQPKRAMISCEKGYIEIMEFPRASKAVLVDAKTGERKECAAGETENALYYEMMDMEEAVRTEDASKMKLSYSKDVMNIMTNLRKEWGMKYPGEEW